jgi:hypothetical protein
MNSSLTESSNTPAILERGTLDPRAPLHTQSSEKIARLEKVHLGLSSSESAIEQKIHSSHMDFVARLSHLGTHVDESVKALRTDMKLINIGSTDGQDATPGLQKEATAPSSSQRHVRVGFRQELATSMQTEPLTITPTETLIPDPTKYHACGEMASQPSQMSFMLTFVL